MFNGTRICRQSYQDLHVTHLFHVPVQPGTYDTAGRRQAYSTTGSTSTILRVVAAACSSKTHCDDKSEGNIKNLFYAVRRSKEHRTIDSVQSYFIHCMSISNTVESVNIQGQHTILI
jgi:hypothetical protein